MEYHEYCIIIIHVLYITQLHTYTNISLLIGKKHETTSDWVIAYFQTNPYSFSVHQPVIEDPTGCTFHETRRHTYLTTTVIHSNYTRRDHRMLVLYVSIVTYKTGVLNPVSILLQRRSGLGAPRVHPPHETLGPHRSCWWGGVHTWPWALCQSWPWCCQSQWDMSMILVASQYL